MTSLLTVGAASLFRGLALKKRGFIWQNFCVFFISLVLLFFPSLLMAHGDVMPHNHADTTFSKNLSLFFFLLLPISVFFAYFLKKSLFSKEVGPSSK